MNAERKISQSSEKDTQKDTQTNQPTKGLINGDLTEKQFHVLKTIIECWKVYHKLPATRNLSEHYGWRSQTAAMSIYENLIKKGYLSRTPSPFHNTNTVYVLTKKTKDLAEKLQLDLVPKFYEKD